MFRIAVVVLAVTTSACASWAPPAENDPKTIKYVACVADSIARQLPDPRNYKITVLDDPKINAFAKLNGEIIVYSGLINIANPPGQLAAAIAHEFGHVLEGDVAKRTAWVLLGRYVAGILDVLMETYYDEGRYIFESNRLWSGVFAGESQIYRTQETKADFKGLNLMARAGFDPRQAIYFWRKLSHGDDAQEVDFYAAHPANKLRLSRMQALIPHVLPLYHRARAQGSVPHCD